MNEQIKQLMLEAGYAAPEIALRAQKLAELIVWKCAKVGERYADGNYEVFNQILEHFGLEEE